MDPNRAIVLVKERLNLLPPFYVIVFPVVGDTTGGSEFALLIEW
jgi:hypothetical protein